MAVKHRKRKSKKGSVAYTSAKRMFMAFSWLAIVLAVIFFVGRYFVNDVSNSSSSEQHESYSQLEEVGLKPGMEVVKLDYKGHSVYFNNDYHIPNCVSYEMLRSETQGTVPRYKNFEPAPGVESSATPADYTRSGYDRGHMAPAADMKWDSEAMKETFYMANICPQNKSLNTGAWHRLEKKVRDWADRDSAIIIVCGPVLSDDMKRIGKTGVAVPKQFFKVILNPNGKVNRAIGFIFNNEKCNGELKKYAVSVDSVEALTGYDFFYNLPDDVEQAVEAKCNFEEWNNR